MISFVLLLDSIHTVYKELRRHNTARRKGKATLGDARTQTIVVLKNDNLLLYLSILGCLFGGSLLGRRLFLRGRLGLGCRLGSGWLLGSSFLLGSRLLGGGGGRRCRLLLRSGLLLSSSLGRWLLLGSHLFGGRFLSLGGNLVGSLSTSRSCRLRLETQASGEGEIQNELEPRASRLCWLKSELNGATEDWERFHDVDCRRDSYLDFHQRSGFDTSLEGGLHDVRLDRHLK